MKFHCVIAYDIGKTPRRTRMARLLEGYGRRVQYSVFEARLSAAQIRELFRRMTPLVDRAAGDSVRLYALCAACAPRTFLWGGEAPWPQTTIIDGEP